MPVMAVSVLALFCIGGVVAIRISSVKTPPSPAEWQHEIKRSASAFIGSEMKECGVIPWSAESSAARTCVQAAIKTRTPFWVLSQGRGEDSQIWTLITGQSDGALHRVHFDSLGWRVGRTPSFSAREEPCSVVAMPATAVIGSASLTSPVPAFECDS